MVTTFPCAIPNKVYTLNASGRVARQQLPEDNVSLSCRRASSRRLATLRK